MRAYRQQLERLSPAERLAAVQSVVPIEIAGVRATPLASPVFVTTKTYKAICEAAEELCMAVVALESHPDFMPGNKLYDLLFASLSSGGKELVRRSKKPSAEAMQRRFRRLDGYLLGGSTPSFIEINQSAPLAISFYERACELAKKLGAPNTSGGLYDSLAQWFITEARANSVAGNTITVAVSMERGYPAKFVDLPVACPAIAAAAKAHGVTLQFVLAEPTEFIVDDDRPFAGGEPFDLLWRNTVYLQNYSEALADYEAIRYGGAPMVNDLQAWLFRSKAYFAMLWDDELVAEFANFGLDSRTLRKHVPETHWLHAVDASSNRTQWILKRCDDGFGKGIVFGSELSESEWQARLTGSYGTDWVAQQIVRPEAIELPVIDEKGTIHDVAMYCDVDLFMVNGAVHAVLVRALPAQRGDSKMNIVAGAAIGCVAATERFILPSPR